MYTEHQSQKKDINQVILIKAFLKHVPAFPFDIDWMLFEPTFSYFMNHDLYKHVHDLLITKPLLSARATACSTVCKWQEELSLRGASIYLYVSAPIVTVALLLAATHDFLNKNKFCWIAHEKYGIIKSKVI